MTDVLGWTSIIKDFGLVFQNIDHDKQYIQRYESQYLLLESKIRFKFKGEKLRNEVDDQV